MGNVIILQETVEKPITLMGQRAGICWESDILNAEKNYKRGLSCLEAERWKSARICKCRNDIGGVFSTRN